MTIVFIEAVYGTTLLEWEPRSAHYVNRVNVRNRDEAAMINLFIYEHDHFHLIKSFFGPKNVGLTYDVPFLLSDTAKLYAFTTGTAADRLIMSMDVVPYHGRK